jgi:hypothetical protein
MAKPTKLDRTLQKYEREKAILKGVSQSTFQVTAVELLKEILKQLRYISGRALKR